MSIKQMSDVKKNKALELEGRTRTFSLRTRDFIQGIEKNLTNNHYAKQLTKSASSIGANYIEANEKFSLKDCVFRMKIARKEAKESIYWFEHIQSKQKEEREFLMNECIELKKILSAIILKLERKL